MKKINNKIFFILSLCTGILLAKDEILWDLGLVISSEKVTTPSSQQKPIKTLNESKGIKVQLPDHTIHNQVIGLLEKLNIESGSIQNHNISEKDTDIKTETLHNKTSLSLLFDKEEPKTKSLQKKGSDFFRSGRYKDALEYLIKIDYNKFTKEEQNKITYLKANAYFQLGEQGKAEEYLKLLTIQRFSPEADDALMLLGMIYKKQNKKEHALRSFKQVLLDFPNSEFYESARIQTRILSQNK